MAGTAGEERQQLNADVLKILQGRVPRQYGELPAAAAALQFEMLAPCPKLDKLVRMQRHA
jgi:hypothetical protein